MTTETRRPHVEMDPEKYLSLWTITALHNHLYAKALGAHFVYFNVQGPMIDGKRPGAKYQEQKDGYCEHAVYGWRTAHFCKMPFAWYMWKTDHDLENLVFIDSDAIFRSPNISLFRHIDQLSIQRPFGVLLNHPWDTAPCSGYWFMARGRESEDPHHGQKRKAVEDFIAGWWNEEWIENDGVWYDQMTLRRFINGDFRGGSLPNKVSYADRVLMLDEWQFELKDEANQMILHVEHQAAHRDQRLVDAWVWGDEYPLDDRARLRDLLEQVDIRVMDSSVVTSLMPLPNSFNVK